jgi:hypothetical protein
MEVATGFLSDTWWQYIYNSYSMSIVGFPIVAAFLLKLVAIIKPSIPTGKILDLIAEYWPSSQKKEPDPK